MKVIVGMAAALLGFFLGVAGLSAAAKPANFPLSLDPVDALATYFFSFSWVGGALGTVIGAALLLAYLALCYALGVRIYKSLAKP